MFSCNVSFSDRVVNSVSQVLGDFNFAEYVNDPAAVHQKCLMCDKPVSARARSAKKDFTGNGGPGGLSGNGGITGVTATLMSRTVPNLDEYEYNDPIPASNSNKHNKFPALTNSQSQPIRLGSPNPNPIVSKTLRPKVSSEITINRTNVESLPNITVSLSIYVICDTLTSLCTGLH